MKQVFYTSFHRDVRKIKNKAVAQAVKNIILITEQCNSIIEIPNLKKLKGHKTAYRIKINNFRLGLFIEENTLFFAAISHRKDIYKTFP